jgi:hypothetical protein
MHSAGFRFFTQYVNENASVISQIGHDKFQHLPIHCVSVVLSVDEVLETFLNHS